MPTATLLLTQLPTNTHPEHGKLTAQVVECMSSTWETRKELTVPGFALSSPGCVLAFGEWVLRWKILSLSVYIFSLSQIKMKTEIRKFSEIALMINFTFHLATRFVIVVSCETHLLLF